VVMSINYESLLLSMEGKVMMETFGRQFNFLKYTMMQTFQQFSLAGGIANLYYGVRSIFYGSRIIKKTLPTITMTSNLFLLDSINSPKNEYQTNNVN